MKIFLTSMLLLQYLLNEARANIDGQTNERVPLMNEDGSATGTTITCSPYSVEYETSDVEYVKYILDTEEEEEGSSTVFWNSQPNITLFEQCASYAAEQNVGMFYFDGQSCETSDTVYERKEKTCNSTSAKMVYMQKGFLPAAVTTKCVEGGNIYNEGEEWDMNVDLPCDSRGRKTCKNGVIIPERNFYDLTTDLDTYIPHLEGVDYIQMTDGICFLKPVLSTGKADRSWQAHSCASVGGSSCSPSIIENTSSAAFTVLIKAFLDSSVANSMNTSQLTVNLFREPGSTVFYWRNNIDFPFVFPATNDPTKNCIVFSAEDSHTPSGSDCNAESTRDVCCMLI